MNTVLVTGGLGFIGSHIAAALLEDADFTDSICIFDNESTCARPDHVRKTLQAIASEKSKSVTFVKGDIRNATSLESAFTECGSVQCVIHCAGVKSVQESISEPLLYYDINVAGTIALLSAMTRHNCSKFIFSSSATVYGEPDAVPVTEAHRLAPINPYGRSKMLAETVACDWHAADSANRSVARLRYMNPVGAHSSALLGEEPLGVPANLQPYVAQVALGERPFVRVFGNDFDTRDGTGVRDYIHVVDLAEAHVAAMKKMHPGFCAPVNLGRGVGVSVLEMIAAFERACGSKIDYRVLERRPGDSAEVYCDASLAKRLFGWQSRLGVNEMCESTWRYLQKRAQNEQQQHSQP